MSIEIDLLSLLLGYGLGVLTIALAWFAYQQGAKKKSVTPK